MHPHPYPTLKPFERWAGLLAAGVTTLAILASLHLLFADAAADPAATLVRASTAGIAGTAGEKSGCGAAAASTPGCDAAAPPAPTRTARL